MRERETVRVRGGGIERVRVTAWGEVEALRHAHRLGVPLVVQIGDGVASNRRLENLEERLAHVLECGGDHQHLATRVRGGVRLQVQHSIS